MKYCSFCPRRYGDCYGSSNTDFRPIKLTIEKAEADLLVALLRLYNENLDLIDRKVHERCLANYIFHYFLVEKAKDYPGYHIDPEYNKNGDNTKKYDIDTYGIPDLIIHRRNCNRENLLYIEFKKDELGEGDIKKLVGFTKIHESEQREKFDYEFLLGCGVCMSKRKIEFIWYVEGKVKQTSTYEYNLGKRDFVKQDNSVHKCCP